MNALMATTAFPPDLPGPWFGFVLLGYYVGGGACVLIAILMAVVFTLRRRLIAVHTLPLFAGLVVYMAANGVAQICRAIVLQDAMAEPEGIPTFSSVQHLRAVLIVVRMVAAVWVVAAIVEALPWMLRHDGRVEAGD